MCVLTGVYPQPQPPPPKKKKHTLNSSPLFENQNIRRALSSSFLGLTAVWLLGSTPFLPTPSKAAPPGLFVAVEGSEGAGLWCTARFGLP